MDFDTSIFVMSEFMAEQQAPDFKMNCIPILGRAN